MKRLWIGAALAAVAYVGLMSGQPPEGAGKGKAKAKAKGPEPCERACLEGMVDDYLTALVAHNPFGLPLGRTVRYTENAQVVDLGDGLWNVTTGIGKYKLIASDPQSQQVAFLGTVLANNRATTLALRLKLENRKITEIESLVNVSNTPTNALDALALDASMTTAVPEGERRTREQLMNLANAYFDGMEHGDTSTVQFDSACNRIENGVQMTAVSMSCADEIASKKLTNYQVVYPRRISVIDEERQLVFGMFMLQQPGDLLEVATPGHAAYRFPEASAQPAFVQAAQMFKVTGGRIARMEALTTTLPYGEPDPFFKDDWRRAK